MSKADRRTVRDDDEPEDVKEEEGSAALVLGSAVLGPKEDARETMTERLEKRKIELNRLQVRLRGRGRGRVGLELTLHPNPNANLHPTP